MLAFLTLLLGAVYEIRKYPLIKSKPPGVYVFPSVG